MRCVLFRADTRQGELADRYEASTRLSHLPCEYT